jgi:ribosomal protein L34E
MLVISQGYDKKKRLYKTCICVNTNDIAKVDFANLIKTDRSATRLYKRLPHETNVQKYKQAKMSYQTDLSICEDCKSKIQTIEDNLARERNSLKYWEERAVAEKNKMDEIVAMIKRKDMTV